MPRTRPGKRLLKALLPIVGLLTFGVGGGALWLAHTAAHPPTHPQLVTPEQFARISPRGVKATEETWANADGTRARGWLLRGAEGAPAVALLHAYGTDRSWLFNLGVKLNETLNFTVLCPDLRGHGEAPPVASTTFGVRESADLASALAFLRSLKTQGQRPLAGGPVGVYGVELGAYAALSAAADGAGVAALALDSPPARPDDIVLSALRERTGQDNALVNTLALAGARLYSLGSHDNRPACAAAARLTGTRVLLLTGRDSGRLRDSTLELARCFPAGAPVETRADLPLTGLKASSATGELGESYDRHVIDFFQQALRADPAQSNPR